ncbi:fatty acid desaturase [Acaryochloris marina]|uniref:fatty acid desaturase family protein n=1 Tax=Acaryochloris marina TaxID=155978 RepID=UPI001BAED0F8|nr:fatty acid desaturase [Acaryochloris marina]QUY43450.1 fatty acid desaturase [Acaryochloris marina S15]
MTSVPLSSAASDVKQNQPDALISHADYVKQLRPLLPDEAFAPDLNKIWFILINLAMLAVGWAIASYMDQWQWYWLWLYLPISLVMGNSVIVLLFSCHDLMHGSGIRHSRLFRLVSFLGLSMLWMPPTLWRAVHNREHHRNTNSDIDPDRNYLYNQPNTWGKWIQDRFVPSNEVSPLGLIVGMGHAWGVHALRNMTSVVLFNRKDVDYVPAAFTVSRRERWAIAREVILICLVHLGIMASLNFDPVKLVFSYFLPIWIGYAGALFYIYTNHMLSPMTAINDPLVNSVSLKVPKIFDVLHFNFSYHTEHHLFPGMNSDYYPLVQELLLKLYPERFHLLPAGQVWKLMLETPRHYEDEKTFTTWSGEESMTCPLTLDP